MSSYSAVEMFRDNLEYDFMEDFQIKSGRPRARKFIENILAMQESAVDGSAES